jgi:hypothetical protein
MGKAQMAQRECQEAARYLTKAGKPLGCVQCNLDVMQRIQDAYLEREAQTRLRMAAKPNRIAPKYAHGVLLFDKRMLAKAEVELTAVSELCFLRKQLAMERQAKGIVSPDDDDRPEDEDYEGVLDDLAFVQDLREQFAADGEARPLARLLPCMQQRFAPDFAPRPQCVQWRDALYADEQLDWGT